MIKAVGDLKHCSSHSLALERKGGKIAERESLFSSNPCPEKNNTYTAKNQLVQDSYESNLVSFPSHNPAFRPRAPCSCYDFGSLAGNSDLFVEVIAHIAAAAVPNPVLQHLKAGQITQLAKPTGGHKPLLMMSFLRRHALKSVTAAKKESVAKCAGPLQYVEDQTEQTR